MTDSTGELYVSNKEFLQEMIEYKARVEEAKSQDRPAPEVTDAIALKIMLIAQRLSFKPNFINYTYRDEMVLDAIENCIRYVDNFDPDRSNNPFSYFTQICYYAFIRRIQKEKKEFHIKVKYVQQSEINQIEHCVQEHDSIGDYSSQYAGFLRGFYDVDLPNDSKEDKPRKSSAETSVSLDTFVDFGSKNDDVYQEDEDFMDEDLALAFTNARKMNE